MGRHPTVTDAMIETTRRIGAGAGETRNISENSHATVMLQVSLNLPQI
jgi:5-aminolevulinate synthase